MNTLGGPTLFAEPPPDTQQLCVHCWPVITAATLADHDGLPCCARCMEHGAPASLMPAFLLRRYK